MQNTGAYSNPVLAPIWLLLMVLASLGWGFLAARLAGVGRESPAPVTQCLALAAGQAILCWLLGWLNYFQQFTPSRAILLMCLGAVFAVAGLRYYGVPGSPSHGRLGRAAALLTLISVTVVLFWVYLPPALNGDDTSGYAAFFIKIRDLGGIGLEPFSGRRHYMLGIEYPFQALILSVLTMRYMSIIEPALGMAVTIVFIAILTPRNRGRFFRLTITVILLGLSGLLGSHILANLTPAFSVVALFFLLIHAASTAGPVEARPGIYIYGAALGLVVCFLTCLRPTTTAFATILTVMVLLSLAEPGRKGWHWRFLKGAGSGVAAAVTLALPFSLDLHRSSGTYLYPYLGKGFEPRAGGGRNAILGVSQFASNWTKLIVLPATDSLLIAAISGFLLWFGFTRVSRTMKTRALVILAGLVAVNVMIAYGAPEPSVHRYAAPLNVAFLLFLVSTFEVAVGEPKTLNSGQLFPSGKRRLAVSAAAALAISVAVYRYGGRAVNVIQRKIEIRNESLYPPEDEIRDYAALQRAAPPGVTIIASLTRCDLLDFKRNRIYINDAPSYVSPPPGWPSGAGALEFAGYLRRNHVDYVAVMRVDQWFLSNAIKRALAAGGGQPFSIAYASRRLLLYRLN